MRWLLSLLKLRPVVLLWTAVSCAPLSAPHPERIIEARELIDRGTLALRAGRLEEAQAAFELAFELTPIPEALDGIGCVAFMRGDAAAAQRYFLAAYDADNSYSFALAHLALLYDLQQADNAAELLYRQALAENPRLSDARNNFAAFLLDKRRASADEVRRQLRKAYLLVRHPLIEQNLKAMQGVNDGQDQKK